MVPDLNSVTLSSNLYLPIIAGQPKIDEMPVTMSYGHFHLLHHQFDNLWVELSYLVATSAVPERRKSGNHSIFTFSS